jgi:antitoxin YefM
LLAFVDPHCENGGSPVLGVLAYATVGCTIERTTLGVAIMTIMTVSDFRANVAGALDAIEDDAEELIITRTGHEPVVVIPLAEYRAWRETEYLLSGANGRRLRASIAQLEAGDGAVQELDEA